MDDALFLLANLEIRTICIATSFTRFAVVKVALPSPFSLPASEFNAFLFAPIGEQANGLPLSVVSALARLDLDPWQEAARLSDLPRESAAAALNGMIQRLPAGTCDQSDTRTLAARLIELLPRRGAVTRSGEGMTGRERTSSAFVWLIVAALATAAFIAGRFP
jgi:hypothetical protein